jgi:hypothetical protein
LPPQRRRPGRTQAVISNGGNVAVRLALRRGCPVPLPPSSGKLEAASVRSDLGRLFLVSG